MLYETRTRARTTMSKLFEQRHDNELEQIEDEQDEPRQSLSDLLDRRRADALAKEADEEQAKKLDALDAQMKRPVIASDLEHKPGGNTPSRIDTFFSDDGTGE